MKSFFGICVLSALVTVGTTQPTHNSPHVGQTQHHTPPEHHMSQPQHHIMSQHEPDFHQPYHYIRQLHGHDSWSTAETQAQPIWISPDEPIEALSQPHHISQPHINNPQPHTIHSQPQPMDPQFELHPYPYQHPHYPPTGSHHTRDTGPIYPTLGWNTQNPAVAYQDPLPEAPAPEHHINSYKEDYPKQSSNSVPVSNHETANPQLYKFISIPKEDDGAVYMMPITDHETRQPEVIHTSKDEGLSDIVQEILAKYRHIPIEIKPKPDNNAASHHNRPHRHKKHKVPTIPVVTKLSDKANTVAVAKIANDKTYTIITDGKHRTGTKAPLKHKHKHSHKKVLKPLLDPEILAKDLNILSKELPVLAKELNFLSKELPVPSPDKTHEKDIPCDNNAIVTDDRTNSDDADRDNFSDSPDKNKPMNKNHSHKSAETTPKNDISEKTSTPSTYIEPYNEKDVGKDTDSDSASLDETTKPCEDDNTKEKENERITHVPKHKTDDNKPNDEENQNTNPKSVDSKTENKDFKEKEDVQKKDAKEEMTKKPETKKKEKIKQSPKDVSETNKNDGKQDLKIDQKDWVLANPDKTAEPCNKDNAPDKENEGKKNILKPDDKHNDAVKETPKTKPTQHYHDEYAQPHTPTNSVPKKEKAKTTKPSTNVKLGDQKGEDRDNDCDSANYDKSTESCDPNNAPEKEDKTKKLQPKTDDKQNTDKPVDKGNIDEVKEDVPRKVETKKEKSEQQSKKTKQQPETYDAKPKPVEPVDKNPAPEHKKEIKKPISKATKDNYKRVSPDTDNEKKEIIIAKQDVIKVEQTTEEIGKVETKKKEKIEQSPKYVPETNKHDGKQDLKIHQKDSDSDWVSANSDKTAEPYNKDNAPDKENEGKKNLLKPKSDDKHNDAVKETPKTKPTQHYHDEYAQPHTPTNSVPNKEKAKSTKPSTNVKLGDQKGVDRDNDCDSANSDKSTESCDPNNAPEKEDKTKKLQPKTDDKQNTDKPVDKGNIDEVKEDVPRKVETKKEKAEQQSKKTKQQPETYDAKPKPVEPVDKNPAPEHKKEIKKPISKATKDNYKRVSPDTDNEKKGIIIAKQDVIKVEQTTEEIGKVETKKKEKIEQSPKYVPETNKHDGKQDLKIHQKDSDSDWVSANSDKTAEPYNKDNAPDKENEGKKKLLKPKSDDKHNDAVKETPKTKPTQHYHDEYAQPHTPTNSVPNKEKAKTTKPSTNVKLGDQKGVDRDNDCDSANSDKSMESCDLNNAPEKEDKTKKLQPKTDDKQNTDKPVDKGNIDEVKEDVPRKVETKKEKAEQQSKKTKQQPETYDAKPKPVEPVDKNPAPEHKKEIKKPISKATKDNYKRVSPDTNTEKKDIIIAKQDEKKVDQTTEVTGKDETKKEDKIYQTMKNVPEPKKYEDKLKPEKQDNESNELQKPFNITPAPEYKRELKEPLAITNKDNKGSKDPTNEKKNVDKEDVIKVETTTKKPTENVVSQAVDKSKSVETSNESSDTDSADCETDPKLDKTITTTEKNDAQNNKNEQVNKEKVTKNKAKGKTNGEELTSDEVAEILEKAETDQPLSTVGFLFSLISHALRGGDSVKQMFEEPKVRTFLKDIIPLFHDKQNEGIISDYA